MTYPLDLASRLLQRAGFPMLSVVNIMPRDGGLGRVEEWRTDGQPAAVIAKFSDPSESPDLPREVRCLEWVRQHTRFPVPEVYGYVSGEEAGGQACLVMERLTGRHLDAAQLSEEGRASVQGQLARRVAELHTHTRDTYGCVAEPETYPTWLDWFAPRLEENARDCYDRLSPQARTIVSRLLDELPSWLPEFHHPTAVHGDLWANNIIVDDRDPDYPHLTGFIDGGGLFTDVEYELAYLLCFHTADDHFLAEYTAHHALRDGFDRRCRVYWLNALLLHLWLFGEEYLPRCEGVAAEIEGLR